MLPYFWEVVKDSALEILGSDADAQDVAQEVIIRLWNHGRWRSIDHPIRFFRQAGRNEALNMLRRRRGFVVADDRLALSVADPSPSACEEIDSARLVLALREAIKQLPPRCRQVCALVFLEGWSHHEVSNELSISVKAVGKQVARGRTHLGRIILVYCYRSC